MRELRVITPQTKSFNILTKLYKLTKNGDIKISNYCNKYFKSVAVNNVNYINKPIGA